MDGCEAHELELGGGRRGLMLYLEGLAGTSWPRPV